MADDKGSLVVAGTGIKFISHLSTETIAYIQQSDKVIYSLNEPAIEAWIKKNNPNVQSLNFLEAVQNPRLVNYQEMTNYIVNEVKKPQHICVVFYGHPAVFAKSALDAVVQLENENYVATILPAISSEDCLFADLRIDPGSHGCQSYEATDFLIRKKRIDPSSHLILWQIGLIGAFKDYKNHDNSIGVHLLIDYLSEFYDNDHSAIVYEAALYPHMQPNIINCSIHELKQIYLSSISTLYIPPAYQASIEMTMLEKLGKL